MAMNNFILAEGNDARHILEDDKQKQECRILRLRNRPDVYNSNVAP